MSITLKPVVAPVGPPVPPPPPGEAGKFFMEYGTYCQYRADYGNRWVVTMHHDGHTATGTSFVKEMAVWIAKIKLENSLDADGLKLPEVI